MGIPVPAADSTITPTRRWRRSFLPSWIFAVTPPFAQKHAGETNRAEELVEGTIEVLDHGLTLGPDAHIRADITARTVTIHGTVVGNIHASAKVEICATGRLALFQLTIAVPLSWAGSG